MACAIARSPMLRHALLVSVLASLLATGCSSTVSLSDSSSNCPLPGGTICPLGTSCPASDGCNTCMCGLDRVLRCTQRACAQDAGVTQDVPSTPVDVGFACSSDADCPPGLGCDGAPGCGVPWTCAHLLCASIMSTWCGCDARTFTTATACARRPYAHPGPCEMTVPADAGACGALGTVCRWGDECCSGWCPPRGAPISECSAPPAGAIGCNDRLCDAATEYCELTYSDVPTPDSATCRPLPSACAGAASCGCVSHPCGGCAVRAPGVLTFRCPGG
jgi:hypothetical protein